MAVQIKSAALAGQRGGANVLIIADHPEPVALGNLDLTAAISEAAAAKLGVAR